MLDMSNTISYIRLACHFAGTQRENQMNDHYLVVKEGSGVPGDPIILATGYYNPPATTWGVRTSSDDCR